MERVSQDYNGRERLEKSRAVIKVFDNSTGRGFGGSRFLFQDVFSGLLLRSRCFPLQDDRQRELLGVGTRNGKFPDRRQLTDQLTDRDKRTTI
jgi:hypothetical protein